LQWILVCLVCSLVRFFNKTTNKPVSTERITARCFVLNSHAGCCARLQDGASCSSQRPQNLRGRRCSFVCGKQSLTTTLWPPVGRNRPFTVAEAALPAEVRDCVRDTRCPQRRESCAAHNLSRLRAFGRGSGQRLIIHCDKETIGERLCAALPVLTSRECKPAHNLSP
jgi:hypothetical protein